MIEISLTVNQSSQRLDKVLSRHLKNAPKSFIYKMLRKKNITLNGQKALGSEKTVAGDTVQFFFSEETYRKMRGESAGIPEADIGFPEIPILYEDSDVCIFVKPAGILSQKAVESDYSINEWIIWHSVEKGLVSASDYESFRPSVTNRLDRNTSGIMCAGLSERGLRVLSALFRDHKVGKYYYALASGRIENDQRLRAYLLKDASSNTVRVFETPVKGSREIRTDIHPLFTGKDRTLLLIQLHTGKSHQIRAHLAAGGHPLIGDPKYGDPAVNLKNNRFTQCLHACSLVFPECELPGISGRVFKTEVPEDWPLGEAGDFAVPHLRK